MQEDKVISIRDPHVQKNKIGIPQEFLERHAYHKIAIKDNNEEVIIVTRVLGQDSYVNGVKTIIEALINNSLKNKRHAVLDLIDNGMI